MKEITIFILCFPIFAYAKDDGFLAKSDLLKKAGITITPVQTNSKGELLPVVNSDSSEQKMLITEQGLKVMETVSGGNKIKLNVKTCGEDALVSPWRTKSSHEKGLFLATESNLDKIKIDWVSSQRT